MTTSAPATARMPRLIDLDASQRRVLELADDASAAVIGAPGSGKTTTLVELVADRVLERGVDPDAIVALTSSRLVANGLREAIALRLGQPTNGPVARTVNSLAYEIVGAAARLAGSEPPRLVTGGEQDADIAALLEGHLLDGTGPAWPAGLSPEVRRLRGFRTELRELMARATEYGVDPDRLRELARTAGKPEWWAAADFMDEYVDVVSATRTAQLDSAELAQFAVAAIQAGDAGDRLDRLRLVIVDDLQEATESTLALLRALAARGLPIVAFGDPDVAANAFRGGEPDALGRFATVIGRPDAETIILEQVHGQAAPLRAVTAAVTTRIGTAAAGPQRRAGIVADTDTDTDAHADADAEGTPAAVDTPATPARPGPTDPRPPLLRIEGTTPARTWAAIARVLREENLLHGTPWSQMAVVVRSGGAVPALARSLALAEVPTRTAVGGSALRDDSTALALLTLVDVGIGRTELTAAAADDLLTSPFGGLDRLALRRLRLALRTEELGGGGTRSSDELLVEALSSPTGFATIDHRTARTAGRLAATLDQLRTREATIEELLWYVWERSGLADPWRTLAMSSGVMAAEANRDLDAVVALFSSAKRFVERRPDAPASEFLAEVLEAEVPEDSLSPRRDDESVLVGTPSAMLGTRFEVVVVAALQDGVWPNLRPRGSLLAPQELVRAVQGETAVPIDDRRLVLDDELRMFALAVSRARRRLVLAAVSNDDESPSVLMSMLPPDAPVADAASARPLSLRSSVGRLRRLLSDPATSTSLADGAASALAQLAAEGVPGADPAEWHGIDAPSSTGELFEGLPVPISPSRMERFEDSPLDWFVETIAGSESSVVAQVGTIVHWAMETALDPRVDTLWEALESRWSELLFEAPWLADRQKRIARVFIEAVSEYLTDFQSSGAQLIGAERRFRLEIDRAVVNGSIDRVERAADGGVVIVDLKTGSPVTSQARIDEHPQLGAYQLAYAEGLLDEALSGAGEHHAGGAKLLFVKSGKGGRLYREGEQAALDAEGLEAVRERIRQAAAGMAAAEFEGLVELSGWGLGDQSGLRLQRVKAVSSD
ncbi:MAG: PD-(D/E)XK nuclease family protein [Microbacteriaceae bacterium]